MPHKPGTGGGAFSSRYSYQQRTRPGLTMNLAHSKKDIERNLVPTYAHQSAGSDCLKVEK